MPVKVRCPGCRKVLTAADGARGRTLKCPDCETDIRIPAQQQGDSSAPGAKPAAKAKAKAKPAEEDGGDDLLANLDVSKAIDQDAMLCPKCGAEIPEGAPECPKCGIDPETGQLSKAAKRRKSFKGIDPAEFFKVVWKDSWRFTMENFVTVIQTGTYLLLSIGSAFACLYFLFVWCSTTPPKVFWGSIAVLSVLSYPGWIWHLNVETVKLTTTKKSSLKDVKYDMFSCIALGIKQIAWFVSHAWFPFGTLCFPVAIIHFAMPVATKGWVVFSTLGLSLKHFGAVAMYWIIRFVVAMPIGMVVGIVAAIYGARIEELIRAQDIKEVGTTLWSVLGVVAVIVSYGSGFLEVYSARVCGLMAFYFRDTLDLQTIIREKTYVKKVVKLDKFGNPIESPFKKYGAAVFAFLGIALAANVIYFFYTEQKHILLPDSWARAIGIIE